MISEITNLQELEDSIKVCTGNHQEKVKVVNYLKKIKNKDFATRYGALLRVTYTVGADYIKEIGIQNSEIGFNYNMKKYITNRLNNSERGSDLCNNLFLHFDWFDYLENEKVYKKLPEVSKFTKSEIDDVLSVIAYHVDDKCVITPEYN